MYLCIFYRSYVHTQPHIRTVCQYERLGHGMSCVGQEEAIMKACEHCKHSSHTEFLNCWKIFTHVFDRFSQKTKEQENPSLAPTAEKRTDIGEI